MADSSLIILKTNEYSFNKETNYFILDNKLTELNLKYNGIDNTSFCYGKDIKNLNIISSINSLNTHKLNLYLVNTTNLVIDISALCEGAVFQLNLLVITNKLKSNILIKTNNNECKTKLVVNTLVLAFNQVSVNVECIGTILNKMKGAINKQILKGYNFNKANIQLTPILKINEYDVSANHGAVIGSANDEEIFYLMSRGLTREKALELIQYGLIKPWLKEIGNQKFCNLIIKELGYNE